jgi:membrane peptidoglycan carboxypeptidase
VSNNDFDGPPFGPASGQGADEQGDQAPGAAGPGADGSGQGTGGNAVQYPAPEGWNDGFWRDSAMDSNYETGMQSAVRPESGPHESPGYSYISDGRGWESAPGPNAEPTAGPGPGPGAGSTSSGPPPAGGFGPGGASPTGVYGPGPGGYGAPMGPGPGVPGGPPGVPGGWGPPPVGPGGPGFGGPVGPGGPGWPGGPGGPGGPVRPGGPAGPGGPRGPQGRGGKRKGSWWRHWTWKKAAAVVGGVCVVFVLGLFGVYEYLSSSATIPTALASATYQNTTVYYSDGTTVLGTIGQYDRQNLSYQQIPKQLQNAVVAAEDKNFWTEGGISPTGIVRAAIHDLNSGGGSRNGGSTITQEFVRGYYNGIGTEQTASRKIKEIFIAQKVSHDYSKQWILTNYMNTIYMGDGAYGMAAAAQTYFGVSVDQLTPSEDAVLAGMIQQPSTFYELSNRAALKARWTYVLQQMQADGYITQARVQKFPTLVSDKQQAAASSSIKASNSDPWAPYLMTQVASELENNDGITDQELGTQGYKVVTTVSRAKEAALYKAVSENLNSQSIRNTSGAMVTSLPPWALVGAELQDPKSGEIIAEYPGKGQTLTGSQCQACMVNTADQSRNQVGSSFKPYVLATALTQGMNVQSSKLNTSPYMCIAPDTSAAFSLPITQGEYEVDNVKNDCLAENLTGSAPVENDEGEMIGKQVGQAPSGDNKGATYFADNVQDALAQSSNTGFTDLAHKVGTTNIIKMAENVGVDGSSSGADFAHYQGGVGLALGIASLTVQEQTTMLSTISDNGEYHAAHLVKYWQASGSAAAPQKGKFDQHVVLTPQQAQDAQYAMEETTINGTAAATVTYGQQTLGTVIGKTGTTTSSKSGFFIGATTQYSLVVGMFVNDPNSTANANNSLAALGGGGFGGYWPAKIWNTFAEADFSSAPQTFPTNPSGEGTAWNMLGNVPKAKPVCSRDVHGHKVPIAGKGCPNPTPTPTCTTDSSGNQSCNGNNPQCQDPNNPNCNGQNPTPTSTCDPNQQDCSGQNPTPTSTCDPNQQNCNGQNPTPTSTCDPNQQNCTGNGGGGGGTGGNTVSAPTATTAKAGLAYGGGLMILPGSLLWTTVSRRRRRKQRAGTAE